MFRPYPLLNWFAFNRWFFLTILFMVFAFWIVAAHAQDTGVVSTANAAAADPHAILLGPLVTWLQPFVSLVLQGLAGVLVTVLAAKLYSWFGVSTDATQVARFKSAAATEAGALVAQASDNLKNASLTVNDPRIVAAANAVIARIPSTAAAIGVTPDVAAKAVLGEVGKLQAAATAPTPVPTPVPGAK